MRFTVHSTFTDAVNARIAQGCKRAEHILAQQIQKDTEPYVPMLTGSLNAQTRVEDNAVIYPAPMSRYLYYGKLMVDAETGSPWAKKGHRKVLTDRNLVFTKDFRPQAQAFWFEASKAQNLDKWLNVAEKAVTRYGE